MKMQKIHGIWLRVGMAVVMIGWAMVLRAGNPVVVHIADPETWVAGDLLPYVGQDVQMDVPFYVCSNYQGLWVSPRRMFTPTNQALPLSTEYYTLVSLNSRGIVSLGGVSGYHRTGERLVNLVVHVNSSSSLTFVSGTWVGNSRTDMRQGPDTALLNRNGQATLRVCGANLEYYLTSEFGQGYGPDDYREHQVQRTKVSKALALINADLYGLVEVQQGQEAVAEIASDLTRLTGRTYSFINDGGGVSGSYTKSCFVYCSETLQPVGSYKYSNTGVARRKYMQCFRELATGETFIYSINHFKAKSGASSATGDDADQGDGQGAYNGTRVREAQSVINLYESNKSNFGDEDILVMGDLNAYGKEDPIMTFVGSGYTDLHRYFHADSSYSYCYSSQAGYLDHALCNSTMLPQVTGMVGFHINSDELDRYTYESGDTTMFRCSDHDPVVVGLRLGTYHTQLSMNTAEVLYDRATLTVNNAVGGYIHVYDIHGCLLTQETIATSPYTLAHQPRQSGMYIVQIYYNGQVQPYKLLIP